MHILARAIDEHASLSPQGFPDRLTRYNWPLGSASAPQAWNPALLSTVNLIETAASPMALLIGDEALLLPNNAMHHLFDARTDRDPVALPLFAVLPESETLFRDILKRAKVGEASILEAQPIKLGPGGTGKTGWFDFSFVPIGGGVSGPSALLVMVTDVTDHIRRTRDLSEAVGRLRLALEGSGLVGIWTKDAVSGICTCDANVARIFGLSAGDCANGVGDDLFINAMHPDDRERVAETLRLAIDTGEPYRARYRVEFPGEPLRWVIASGKPAFAENGALARLLGVIIDVTDHMETVAALAESRFQFETLTEALPQIVWSCDAEGRHDYFSARWSEFTGILPEDITEESWKELVHPDDWSMVSREWGAAMREGKPYDIDYRFRHHTGAYRWLRVMALPIRDEAGAITRWFGTSTDVHDAYLLADEREALRREMERIAREDQLTGVLTRRAFRESAAAAFEQARRADQPASLLMIDIDHFKSINDTYGHPAGDRVLAGTAERMRGKLEDHDLIGRIGGEEFAILLPGRAAGDARMIAERMRRAVASKPFLSSEGAPIHVTISIGVAGSRPDGISIDSLFVVADKALYLAKAGGRNRSKLYRASCMLADHPVAV